MKFGVNNLALIYPIQQPLGSFNKSGYRGMHLKWESRVMGR